ncbi:Rhs element Vgr protein [Lysobacter dokdonensis DS-58]|uniref:Rhs element Vgr protein n=1 Tax=Lysobacter dokdonensis DS-58 TaxID=1300345 RepID=A0A0A2WM62_9GAMM|nr:phage baseplate assembly protein V [Lysobacter dokdonensis]KGQ19375.1 Rhs element Vgr protein [Lysobacter dokdonensis DS-58]
MERENGIVIGIVDDLDDQEDLGRVRVRFPHLNDEVSNWARIATPFGGKGRGLFLRPERDDEVLVAFEHGDPRAPYIVGSLWSKPDPPPKDDGKRTDNNWRFLQSRSGHLLKFDDTDGKERVEIVGKDGNHKIVIDVSGAKIEITCSSGDIVLSAPSGKVSIDAQTVEIKSSQSTTVKATGSMTLSGQTVAIN